MKIIGTFRRKPSIICKACGLPIEDNTAYMEVEAVPGRGENFSVCSGCWSGIAIFLVACGIEVETRQEEEK